MTTLGAGARPEPLGDQRPAAAAGRLPWLRPAERTLSLVTAALILAATGLALWLRVNGLPGQDGTLSIDEARLALAARGVLEHGAPVLPSGWVYTRGLLASYLVAPSFAVVGQSDFAARLPSVLAGTALVPVVYLLGRELAGRPGGLFAALFVASFTSLVTWSRQAWFYALYVLLYAAALHFIVRAQRDGRPRDQILAGALVGLTFFTHELGLFLLLPLGAQVAAAVGRRGGRGRRPGLTALALALGAAGLLWLLVTRLRADTLAGSYGEVAEYFSPHLEADAILSYARLLYDSRGLILAAALLGVPLAIRQRRFVVLILWLALLPPFVHAATIIPGGPQDRYVLTVIVVLVALAVQSVAAWSTWAVGRFKSRGLSAGALAGVVLAVILVAHLDLARSMRRAESSPREGAWLRDVRAANIGPEDLVMTDVPTVLGWYVGGVDYWVSSREFEKYTLRAGDVRRDVHTGAVLVRNAADFRRLVGQSNAGRTLWVIASGRSFQWGELVDDDLKELLERTASERFRPGDGSRILRIELR